jgi:hypothetical protein
MDSRIELLISEISTLIEQDFFKTNLKGRKGLRSSVKSDAHPLLRYVHRMIKFHGGLDVHMPMTTQFYLQDFVDMTLKQGKRDKNRLTVYLLRDGVEHLYHILDNHALMLCPHFGLNPNTARDVWQKAFLG